MSEDGDEIDIFGLWSDLTDRVARAIFAATKGYAHTTVAWDTIMAEPEMAKTRNLYRKMAGAAIETIARATLHQNAEPPSPKPIESNP